MPTDLTRDGMISALVPSTTKAGPTLIRDVLRMKRNRGDADADQFKALALYQFASGLNASISGASWAMRQWLVKADKLGWSDRKVARSEAFLADLDAVLAGDMRGWDVCQVEAA